LRTPPQRCPLRDGKERARHLLRNALHSTGTYTNFAGNFVDAFTCSQLVLDALFNLLAYARPTQRLTGFYGPSKASVDALTDHRTLELSERAGDLEHEATGGRRGVNGLLIAIQVNAASLQRLNGAK
jgi:hypothetical protein